MNQQQFGDLIRQRREELNLSQKDLAVALGLDQGKVSLIERGGRKIDSVTELPVLARVLQKPISWFFESDDLIPDESDPIGFLIKKHFPGVEFSQLEMKRIRKMLNPVIQSLVQMVKDDDSLTG